MMIFDSWTSLVRILSVGATSYLALVVLLRISDKRTLTKLNAFDLVVTVALGSTLATVLLDKSVTLSHLEKRLGCLTGARLLMPRDAYARCEDHPSSNRPS